MEYSSSLEKLWKFNQENPGMLIAKIRRCFKCVFDDDIFEQLATKIHTQRNEAARELLLHSLKTSPDKDIVLRRLELTIFLDKNTNKNKVKKQEAIIINANKLAAEQEWHAAEKLLLGALKEEENQLYLEALKSIYQAQQRYTDEKRIDNRLLSLKSLPFKLGQRLEATQPLELMPSVHDLEYLEQASQSLAPLEEQETLAFTPEQHLEDNLAASEFFPKQETLEFTAIEPVSTAVLESKPELEIKLQAKLELEPEPEPELELGPVFETVAKPETNQQQSVKPVLWLEEEPDDEFEADEAEVLPVGLFAEVDDDDYSYDTSYRADDELHSNESQQLDVFEDELYFYQFDPDELLADNDSLQPETTATERITREERALQKAAEFVGKFDWPYSSLSLLKRVFYLNGWGATRVALEREAEKGLTPSELALAAHLKAIWANNEMYWIAFEKTGSFNLSHGVLSWPTALLIVRSFAELPQLSELEVLMEELFEAWYENRTLCRVHRAFARYLWFRFSDLRGSLPPDLWFDFLPPSDLPVEQYSDLGSYDLLEIEKHKLLSEYGVY